jgi:hypothetical protein
MTYSNGGTVTSTVNAPAKRRVPTVIYESLFNYSTMPGKEVEGISDSVAGNALLIPVREILRCTLRAYDAFIGGENLTKPPKIKKRVATS